jgi:hypothetical protein
MNIMGSRLIHLGLSLAGYLKTGVSLIEFDGNRLIPSFTADDLGIYVFIPKLATFFNISLSAAIDIFFYGMLYSAFFWGAIGFYYFYSTLSERLVSVVGFGLLVRFASFVGDVYLCSVCSVMSLLPWAFCLFYKKKATEASQYIYAGFAGFYIGIMHTIRSWSGFGPLLSIVVLILYNSASWRKKGILIVCLFCSAGIPWLYMQSVYTSARSFCQENIHDKHIGEPQHVFWHPVYLGFGFLSFLNPDNIKYDDSCGEKKVLSIDPTITIAQTNAYENILKDEVFKLIRNHFNFVILTLFAKLGILIFFMLKFANFGLLLSWFFPKPFIIDYALLVGISFNALFPLLVMPMHEYSMGFIAYAVIYGIMSINFAISEKSIGISSLLATISSVKKRLVFSGN